MRRLLRPRVILSATIGVITAVGCWLFWQPGPRAVLSEVSGRCWRLAFSPDGRYLVTSHYAPRAEPERWLITLWDTSTCREQKRLFEGPGQFAAFQFSPDGHQVAALHRDGDRSRIHVWDIDRGQEQVFSPAGISPNTCWRLAYSAQHTLLVWDYGMRAGRSVETGRVVFDAKREEGLGAGSKTRVMHWDAEPGTDYVLFYDDEAASVVNIDTGAVRARFPHRGLLDPNPRFAVSANGQRMVARKFGTGGWGPTHVFERATGAVWRCPAADSMYNAQLLSPGGDWVVGQNYGVPPQPWWMAYLPWTEPGHAVTTFDAIHLTRATHVRLPRCVYAAGFSPDGGTLALADDPNGVELWDFPLGAPWSLVIGVGLASTALAWLVCWCLAALPYRLLASRMPTFSRYAGGIQNALRL